LESERFEGGSGKIESDPRGGVGGTHRESGIGMAFQIPIGDPNLHVFLGNFYLPESASAEFFGKKKTAGADIRDGQMSEVDVAYRPSGVGLGGNGLESVTEEGEFVAIRVSVFIVEVSGEVPPFGFEFWVGSVIPRERPGPWLHCTSPRIGRMESRGCEEKEENREKFFHSERRASAGKRRDARHAGGREARRQAIIMPTTIPNREGNGVCQSIVHPKKARLMTCIKMRATAKPVTSPRRIPVVPR